MIKHPIKLFLAAAFLAQAAAATDYAAEFISLGMDGDLVAAEQVLNEWTIAQPDNPTLPSMQQLLADWQADAAVVEPYPPVAEAIMVGAYGLARSALEGAASNPLATSDQQAGYLAWIERFEAQTDQRSIAALQLEFADFELQRWLHQFELAGRELKAADAELDAALAELAATVEGLDTQIDSLEASQAVEQ